MKGILETTLQLQFSIANSILFFRDDLIMKEAVKFTFGEGCFIFYGSVNQNEIHRNAAYQILLSSKERIYTFDKNGTQITGTNILIRPLFDHKIKCESPVLIAYISPQLDFSLNVLSKINGGSMLALDQEQIPFRVDTPFEEISKLLSAGASKTDTHLDRRLLAAIEDLNCNLQNTSIQEVADRCNLSRSRLRALAREQLGMPLSTWLIWKKLVAANKSLSSGASLSEAAQAGGFADQAHFSRTMKKMFGVTPSNAANIYT